MQSLIVKYSPKHDLHGANRPALFCPDTTETEEIDLLNYEIIIFPHTEMSGIFHHYHPRITEGNVFILSVCLSVWKPVFSGYNF